jgi:hypothetical protein
MAADDGEEQEREEAALEQRKASRQRMLGAALSARTAAQAATDAAATAAAATTAAAAEALGKRTRKASKKVLEQAETVALLASPLGKVRRGSGMAAKTSMRRRAAPAAGAGDNKMEGFEARRGSNPAYQPMALLPGEQPLGVELFFGEGRPLQAGRKLGPPTPGALLAAAALACPPAALPDSASYLAGLPAWQRCLMLAAARQAANQNGCCSCDWVCCNAVQAQAKAAPWSQPSGTVRPWTGRVQT